MKRLLHVAAISALALCADAGATEGTLSPQSIRSLERVLIEEENITPLQFKRVEQAIADQAIARLEQQLDMERIVGGDPSPQGEFPWMVALIAKRSDGRQVQFCGGTLIARNKVLTAAHCYVVAEKSMFVSVNNVNLTPPLTGLIPVAKFTPHPDYVRASSGSDVAVITLAQDATVTPLPLATVDPAIPEDTLAFADIAGWGLKSEGGAGSLILLKAEVPYASRQQCLKPYPGLPAKTLCAGFKDGGVDTCQGDSGGPLFAAGEVVGITSYGEGCARKGFYGVYTSVASFRPWIANQ